MANHLPQKKLDQMFKAYCERQSIQFVSRKCSVSPTTARRYKRLGDWDGRLVGIQQKMREKQDDTLANLLAENLKVVRFAKGRVLNILKDPDKDISTAPVNDLDKLVRLELFLSGEAENRTEIVDERFAGKSIDELISLRKKLKKSIE